MRQKQINQIITLTNKLKAHKLSTFDLEFITDYIQGKIEYDVFVSWFDSKNPKYKEVKE